MIVERHGLACSPIIIAMSKNKFLRVFSQLPNQNQPCMACYNHLQILFYAIAQLPSLADIAV